MLGTRRRRGGEGDTGPTTPGDMGPTDPGDMGPGGPGDTRTDGGLVLDELDPGRPRLPVNMALGGGSPESFSGKLSCT